jgi:hypothetical protein
MGLMLLRLSLFVFLSWSLLQTASAAKCLIENEQNQSYGEASLTMMTKICQHYAPQIQKRYQESLVIEFTDSDELSAKYDPRYRNEPRILFGARLPKINRDTPTHMAMILCHEIGHGLAGGKELHDSRTTIEAFLYLYEDLPNNDETIDAILKKPGYFNEGESDYFAISCMKQLVQDKILSIEDFREISPSIDVSDVCNEAKNTKLCEKLLMNAKLALSPKGNPQYRHHLNSLRRRARDNHPSKKCRLHTFKAAYFNEKFPKCWTGKYR